MIFDLFVMLYRLLTACALGLITLPMQAQAATCGYASHYGVGDGFHGQTTANGERFDAYRLTTAHPSLPMGTRLRVTNQRNGSSVIVRVNDRGPYHGGRILDLSYGAFGKIAPPSQGEAKICYSVI